jgi:hypothetical protein
MIIIPNNLFKLCYQSMCQVISRFVTYKTS